MTADIQFISVVDNLEILEVTEVAGAVPRTVRVLGRDSLQGARRVEINNVGIDNFVVASDRVILANPPDTIFASVSASQMQVVVVTGTLSSGRRARLVFAPTLRTRKVDGIQKLVQQVVKELLSDIGSDRFDVSKGGDIVRGIGEALSSEGQARTATLLSQGASNVQDTFLTLQSRDRALLPTERLLSFELVRVEFNTAAGEVTAFFSLVSLAGRTFELPLVL